MSGRPAALGIDIGTTSVKAGLLWLDDPTAPMTIARAPYPSSRPRPGWVEQDPDDWMDGIATCWSELSAVAGPVDLQAIGICSQVNTHVLVDGELRPIHPAITWQDIRAASEAAALDDDASDGREELWGGPFVIDASFALSRLAWLQANVPDARVLARWLLLPRDLVLARLTGRVATDAISPVGLIGPGDLYIDGVLDLVPGSAELVPPIGALDDVAGETEAGNPAGLPEGVPVAIGTMDAWASVIGSGLLTPGRAMDVGGTSEVVAVSSERTVGKAGIISFPPFRGTHLHAGPTQAGGAAATWAASALGLTLDELLAAATEARSDPQPIIFLPHLAGERAPYWNPDARGTFVGITTSTETRHLALAVLEGVAFSVRMVLETCEAAAGVDPRSLRLSGGSALSATWNAIKTDATGRPVDVLRTLESSVLGAALIAQAALGHQTSLEHLAEQAVAISERIEPDAACAIRLERLYGVYQDTYRALEPIFPRLPSTAGRPD